MCDIIFFNIPWDVYCRYFENGNECGNSINSQGFRKALQTNFVNRRMSCPCLRSFEGLLRFLTFTNVGFDSASSSGIVSPAFEGFFLKNCHFQYKKSHFHLSRFHLDFYSILQFVPNTLMKFLVRCRIQIYRIGIFAA